MGVKRIEWAFDLFALNSPREFVLSSARYPSNRLVPSFLEEIKFPEGESERCLFTRESQILRNYGVLNDVDFLTNASVLFHHSFT